MPKSKLATSEHAVDFSVVLVNFNGQDFIRECLDAVFETVSSYDFDVIVVDNASSDDSLDIIKGYGDRLTLVENSENTGFSYANNQAVKLSSAPYVFLLNTDAILQPDTIDLMMVHYENNLDIGAITPKLLNADGSLQVPGNSIGAWRFKQDRVRKVPFIAGAAFLMRRSVYDAMGGLDENLFFYNDDVDMCRYMRSHDLPIIYFPETSVVHYGGLSTVYRRRGSLIEGYRGGIYLALKHYGKLAQIVYRLFLMVDLTFNLILLAFQFPFSAVKRDLFFGYLEIVRINMFNDIYLDRVRK